MARIITFREYDKQASKPVSFDADQTQDYVYSSVSGSTPNGGGDRTELETPTPNSDLGAHCTSMKDIHDKLKNIFAGVRSKMDAFRSVEMRQSFERELLRGVDSVGRAYAILLPSARGI